MAVILFYTPFDQRSRDTESLAIAFRSQGHHVISLSQSTGDDFHPVLKEHGIETFTHIVKTSRGALYYLKHILYLIRFCNSRKVDVVYAHLEPANFVAVIAQYFISAKVCINRHHVDDAQLQKFDRSAAYRLTYRLAKRIIVVSARARDFMVEHEGVPLNKIMHINLGFDFTLYAKPDKQVSAGIRASSTAKVILVTVGRLTKFKRTNIAIYALKIVRDAGIDASLIILGRGDEEALIRKEVSENGLGNYVSMPGLVRNVPDYLAAADFLLHPSASESSCVVVKEAALVGLPVIVCAGVGDFDDYVRHMENGFVVDKDTFAESAAGLISRYVTDKVTLQGLSGKLAADTKQLFDIQNVVRHYDKLNSN